ncbi:hypothetical protein BBK36DRAFT_1130459 [Trichoderma citrinoviride]|uniref:Uncharacterized protein n=1 Tax=Trichoderma citrinoviride TaxID=58853 RepID=A0A2T4AXV2_9HYPO|nr:hypothetical protein BBK36DRAFT_1130459 [Trichoderma citrinoviride]PTB61907.1 hypothetical protein BBK36DRAFT_1130459 [Trichoderma citrinoviride]
MSSSINIPAGPSSSTGRYGLSAETVGSSSDSSYSSSPSHSSPSASPKSKAKGKGKETATALESRRPSLLSSAFSKQECTVINIGSPDGPPRLISYLSSAQGFMWNPEIFLPSYIDCDYVPLENRRDPVHEIHLTDEEMKNMLPQ